MDVIIIAFKFSRCSTHHWKYQSFFALVLEIFVDKMNRNIQRTEAMRLNLQIHKNKYFFYFRTYRQFELIYRNAMALLIMHSCAADLFTLQFRAKQIPRFIS